jgi:hypothetical protein
VLEINESSIRTQVLWLEMAWKQNCRAVREKLAAVCAGRFVGQNMVRGYTARSVLSLPPTPVMVVTLVPSFWNMQGWLKLLLLYKTTQQYVHSKKIIRNSFLGTSFPSILHNHVWCAYSCLKASSSYSMKQRGSCLKSFTGRGTNWSVRSTLRFK